MNTTTTTSTTGSHPRPDPSGGGSVAARLPSFRTPVRGHAFAPRRADTPDPIPGEPAELVPEPTNPADPHAVAVWAGEGEARRRIGYLDRAVAARVAPRMRGGLVLAARVDGWTREPEGRWQRPVVLLQAISLEPVSEPAARADRGRDASPGVWGRPPGVARRTLGPAGPREPVRRPARPGPPPPPGPARPGRRTPAPGSARSRAR